MFDKYNKKNLLPSKFFPDHDSINNVIIFRLNWGVTKYFKMSHSKTKFNNSCLKKKHSNGHLLEWWCKSHDSDKFKAVCKLCDKEIQVANNCCFALMQHAKQNMHKQKAVVQNI